MIFPALGPSHPACPCPRAEVGCAGFPAGSPLLYITPLQNTVAQGDSCVRSQAWTSAGHCFPAEIHAVSVGHSEGSWDPAGGGKLLRLGQRSLLRAGSHSMGRDKSKASSDTQSGGRNPASLWWKSQSVHFHHLQIGSRT